MNTIDNHKVELFILYSHNDDKWRNELEKHLKVLEKKDIISVWHDGKIVAGSEKKKEIDKHLFSAKIILLLISSDFIASDYCYSQEMEKAIERHYNNETIVIPIILRAVEGVELTPFGKIESLPQNAVPITLWSDLDEAFSSVVKGIRERIQMFVNKDTNVCEGKIDNDFSYKYRINKKNEKDNLFRKDTVNSNVIHNRIKESAPYTYRSDFISKISEQLNKNKVAVITGLGGIGKTQLAANYITEYMNKYKLIGWINASNILSIQNSYIELVEKLDSEYKYTNIINQDFVLKYMKNWLENHEDWLIIYDNVKNPKELKEVLPNPINGHIIITSQKAKWSKFNPTIELKKLTREESISFLMKKAEKDYEYDMEELISLLDNFPLALEHAASYIHKTSRSFSYYLNKFKSRRSEMLSKAKIPEDYNHTIATTWEIAFDEIKEKCPDAIEFLYFISFLAPEDIPLEMLKIKEESEINIVEILRDDFRIDDVIESLLDYSLINCNNCTNKINIHKLVQVVVNYKLSKDIKKKYCEDIINIFNKILSNNINDLSNKCQFKELLPHAIQLIENARDIGIKSKELSVLCENVGLLLNKIADYEKAIKILKYGLNIGEKIFNYYSKEIANYIINLGFVEKLSGNINEGLRYYNKAVNIYEKLNLICSLEYALLINNIGRVKMDQGKYEESHELIFKSFQILEKLNLQYDVKNIVVLSNLALSFEHIGDINSAIKINRKVLEILKENNLKESQEMATCLNNLSCCLIKKNKSYSALVLNFRSIKIEESIVGDKHPISAIYYSNIASLLIDRGEFLEARKYIIKALKINKHIYGMKHYSIGKEFYNCFNFMYKQKKYKPAKKFLEESIKIYEQFYGINYSELAQDYYQLASVIIEIIDNPFIEVNFKLKYAEESKLNLYKSLKIKYSEKARALLNFVEFIIKKLNNDNEYEIKDKENSSMKIFFFMGEENSYIFNHNNI